jgi:MgtC family
MQMPLFPTWTDIVVRLLLTMIAGALMGFNRGAKGHAAGLRTTILVALAASIAMIQANILLPLDGKQPGSFAVMYAFSVAMEQEAKAHGPPAGEGLDVRAIEEMISAN